MDGVKFTGPGTVTEPEATVGAALDIGDQIGGGAAHFAAIFIAAQPIFIMGAAVHDGSVGERPANVDTHDGGDVNGATLAAHGALVNGYVFESHCLSVFTAANVAAPAAVGPGKDGYDVQDPVVNINVKLFVGPAQYECQHYRHG